MNRIWKIILISFIVILFVVLSVVINNNINFYLNGESKYTILVNSNYEDKGFVASFFDKDMSDRVQIDNNLDLSKIGNYYIYYKFNFLFREYELKREIKVVDSESPVIYLNGNSDVSLYVGDIYVEYGAVANDNYDGDLTSSIKIEGSVDTYTVGTYELKYSVLDSSGNESFVIRKINVNEKIIITPVVRYNCIKYYDNYNNDDSVIKYINDNNLRVSIGYYNLVDGSSYFYKPNKIYYGASLLKTLDAIYVYDNNLLNDKVNGWVEKAISISDNNSHYFLYNYIGLDNLQKYGFGLGACNTLVGTDNYGNTSVSDQIVYLKKLYSITKDNEELKSYFINDYGNYLKFNDIDIMHKYGFWGSYYHDVGIVLDDTPYIIVVLTEHGNGNYKDIINNISKLIYEYHESI